MNNVIKITGSETIMDIPAFFHTILFAYQRTNRDILGSGENVLLHPILETITLTHNKKGVNLIKGATIDEVLDNFAKELENTGFIQTVSFEKIAPEKFRLRIEGCAFADGVHDLLKPKDVSCPFAIMAKAIYQQVTNKRVYPTDSKFTKFGQQCTIEPLILE